MPDTIVHTAEDVAGGTVAGLASAVGSVTNEVAHVGESVTDHAAHLLNIDEDIRWLKQRLETLEATALQSPGTDLSDLRHEMTALRAELTAQTAALSEALTPAEATEEQTEAPPAHHNEAEPPPPKGPFQRLRGALHRLL